MEDRISQLPDEVLADIVSILTLKEAGRSSVLSKRWRYLWKLTTRLNFDGPGVLLPILKRTSSELDRDIERSNFVTWVNEVLRMHVRSTIDVFKVRFNLDAIASDVIDEWVKFMIRKRPKRVEIDLTPDQSNDEFYTISQECYDHITSASNLSNIKNFRTLLLGGVNVDGTLVEYLLSNCPHLEMLSISSSNHLVNLKVDGPSLALKYLTIRECSWLECIELSAPKLVTFIYAGPAVKLLLGSNPLLAKLNIGGSFAELNIGIARGQKKVVARWLGLFESYFSQLQSLTLSMAIKDDSDVPQVSEIKNLKYLNLVIHGSYKQSLSGFTRLIVAAPSLVKLSVKLKLQWCYHQKKHTPYPDRSMLSEHLIQPHHCLKQVEISGYPGGSGGGFNLAWYVIKTAVNLEKIVIDPGNFWCFPAQVDARELQIQMDKEVLIGILPPGAELIVKKASFW